MRSAASMILMLTLIVGGMVFLGHTMFQSQVFQTIRVGVVIPKGASELQLISQFISSMDSVKSICSFAYMAQNEALEELGQGEIQAVISLPESLYEDIYIGQSAEVTVYFPKDSSLNVLVFREILNDGVKMLQSAEAAVFASKDAVKIYETHMDQYEVAQYISYRYLEEAFDRGDIFHESVLLPFGSMNLYQYYVSAGLSILLLMLGVMFGYLYSRQTDIVAQKLKIMGLGSMKLSLIKVLVMSLFLWIFSCACYIGLCAASNYFGVLDLWFEGTVFVGLFLIAAALGVYFHLIYSVVGNGYQGSVFLLTVNILMLICSGAVIPVAYMPDIGKVISRYMPLNYLNQSCAALLYGSMDKTMIVGLLIWIICIFAIGVLFSWNNLSHGTRFYLKRG